MKSFKLKNRALAAFLCLALVGGFVGNVFIRGSEEAEASGSLPGITELKNSNSEYNILEIVPDVSQAAFSWYLGDSEPINEKKITTAYGSDANTLQEKYEDARSTLVTQNYLTTSQENGDYSTSILKNLGEVSVSGSNVSGGFENNEWFHRYVLDWNETETKANIKMTVLSPQNVTEAHIQLADMVIISGAYYYPNTTVDPMIYSSEVTVSSEVASAIISNSKQGMPVILDRRAYQGSGLESDRIFTEILGSDPTTVKSGVYGSVFFFSSIKSGDEANNNIPLQDGSILGIVGAANQGYLVTSQFNTPFAPSVSDVNGTFSDVLLSIQKENVTRLAYQQSLLPEEITMARVVQYLISDTDASGDSLMKDGVRVLSIQPGDASGIAEYNSSIHDSFGVAAPSVTAKVGLPTDSSKNAAVDEVSWDDLEKWTGVTRDKIDVTEMTMGEFIRQDDVVATSFDLVYLGNDISENLYGVYEENAQFNSNGQSLAATGNQTYFAAIGDSMSKPGYSYNNITNDISMEKYNELIDYVTAGRPVVVAPYLSAGLNYNTNSAKPTVMTIDPDSNLFKLMTVIGDQTCVMRQDMLLAGPDGVEGNSDDDSMIETLVSLVHIPTPKVVFATLSASMPEVYSENAVYSASGDAQTSLEYIFKVSNPTVMDSGFFKVAVSLDLDGDGDYEVGCNNFSSFKVTSLVTDTDGTLLLDSNMNPQKETQVGYNELVEGKYYQVSFDLPDTVEGIVPWKLDVTSVNNASISATTMSLTYAAVSEPVEISVLQIFAESSEDMALNKNMLSAMGLDGNEGSIASQVDFTLHTISLENFDIIGSAVEENTASLLIEYANDIAGFVPEAVANEEGTGQLAMAVAMNAYDVVILSSYAENASFGENTIAVLQTKINSEKPILYSHAQMPTSYIPTDGSTGDYFWNTNSFKNYPYELDMTNKFVVSIGENYYTNADVATGEMDCKIIVNAINVIVPFSESEDLGDNGDNEEDEKEENETPQPEQGPIEEVVDFYSSANGTQKITTVEYVSSADTDDLDLLNDFVNALPMTVYFEVGLEDVSKCHFSFELISEEDVTALDTFTSVDGGITYKTADSVSGMARYAFEIPESYANKVTSIMVKVQDADTTLYCAVGELTLKAGDFINLFETNNDDDDDTTVNNEANVYPNLIPIG